jgi:hypothetical protein
MQMNKILESLRSWVAVYHLRMMVVPGASGFFQELLGVEGLDGGEGDRKLCVTICLLAVLCQRRKVLLSQYGQRLSLAV